MIEESINWDKEIVFSAVSDWYVPGLLDLCQKYTKIKHKVKCPNFQKLQIDSEAPKEFKSKNGQTTLFVRSLG